ncbi:hypothetical protein AB0C22_02550 [Micromonospora sp. NPDC048894]|uniref:hypothetical protein n=1 Tax=unclassified Micromonospora TaxID=2617518 RepID=UPI0033D9E50F
MTRAATIPKAGSGQSASEELSQQDVSTSITDGSPMLPEPRGRSGRGKPIKITVNLIVRAWTALEDACRLTGESKTDAVNRSIQLYAFMQKSIQSGHVIKLVGPDGKEREIHLL